MRTTPDYDLAPYLASGRQLRAQAFLSVFRAIRYRIKGVVPVLPKATGQAQNA
jgi:hypothetical protein